MRRSHSFLAIVVAACSYPTPPDVPVPQLFAIHPSIANTGDAITLEGTFSDTTMVNFPGGAVEHPTLLGPHRARVIVPAGATAGELTVTTGSVTTRPLPFRRATVRGVQQFDGDGSCVDLATIRLDAVRGYGAVAQVKDFLYVLGGASPTTLNTIGRASIKADGSLEPFATLQGIALVAARFEHTIAITGEWLYVLGGQGRDLDVPYTIERAHINEDGSLGPFKMRRERLEYPRHGHSVEMIGNRLYVFGGGDPHAEVSEIDANGELGSFTAVSEVSVLMGYASNIHRFGATSAVVGDSLYVLGGNLFDVNTMEAGDGLSELYRAAISGEGLLPFALTSTRLVANHSYPSSALIGKSLYVFGGFGIGSTEWAPVDELSSLGSFQMDLVAKPVTPRSGAAAVILGDQLYLLGGFGGGKNLDTIECARIDWTSDSASALR